MGERISVAVGTGSGTSVVSFSVDFQTLSLIHDFAQERMATRSAAIRMLIKYGLIYKQWLDDQERSIEEIANGVKNGTE